MSNAADKRILVLTTSYPRFEGDEVTPFIQSLIRAYARQGLRGYVLVPQDKEEPQEIDEESFRILRYRYGIFSKGKLAFGSGILPNLRKNPLLFFQIPLFFLIPVFHLVRLKKQVTLVHANWVWSGLVASYAKLITGVPYVVTLRGEDAKLLSLPVIGIFFRWALRRACAVTTVSESLAKMLFYNFHIEAHCIPNGVDVPEIPQEMYTECVQRYELTNRKPYLIFVGSIVPRKRIEELLKVLQLLPREYQLILVGRTEHTEYVASLHETQVQQNLLSRVHFLGALSHKQVFPLLQEASVYVSASRFEGRPNAVLEALALGLPVVASDIPGHKELAEISGGAMRCFESVQEAAQYVQEQAGKRFARPEALVSWDEAAGRYIKQWCAASQ